MNTNTVGKSNMGLARIAALAVISISFAMGLAAGELEIRLERSVDLDNWEGVSIDCEMLTEDGEIIASAGASAGFYRLRIVNREPPVPLGFVAVPGGTLAMSMGTVTVGAFYMGQYEVTWAEWQSVRAQAASLGYDIGGVGAGCADNHPVHTVNWYDVLKWCNLKSELEGLTPVYTVDGSTYRTTQPTHTSIAQNLSANGYRLPLEAEWEFAARGGNQSNGYTYAGSNDLNAVGWYNGNSGGAACDLSSGLGTWPIGGKAPNELGLYDMSGNVAEWCWDQINSFRSFRGGSATSEANICSVSNRLQNPPSFRWVNCGLRLARSSGQ